MASNKRVKIGGDQYSRVCTVGTGKVRCPNTSTLGKWKAEPGDFIVWDTTYTNGETYTTYGRVLGQIVSCDSDGVDFTGYLAVMAFICEFSSCCIRWVNPKEVTSISKPQPEFMSYIMGLDITPDNVVRIDKAIAYGSMNERYFTKGMERHGLPNGRKVEE